MTDYACAATFIFTKKFINVDDVFDWSQRIDRLAAQLPLLPSLEVVNDLLNPLRLGQVVE